MEIAAKEGNEYGQLFLGELFYYGSAGQDYEKAFNWYLKAAKQGNALSQNVIGYMYHKGFGCDRNQTAAKIWFKKAVKQRY